MKSHWIKIIFFIAAYSFLFYKVSTFNFHNINGIVNGWSLAALLLVPLNWFIEVVKWQMLTKISCCKLTLNKAYKSVIYGLIASVPTPNRIGDYYGRTWITSDKTKKNQLFLTSLFSSFLQTIITLIAGTISYLWLVKKIHIPFSIVGVSLLAMSIALIIIIKIKKKYFAQIINHINSKFNYGKFLIITLLAILRYIIFIIQAYLLFLAIDSNISITQTFSGLSLIYLITLFIPSFFWAELGIRGSLASIIFPMVGISGELAVIAISTLWLLNIGLPVVIGSLLMVKK